MLVNLGRAAIAPELDSLVAQLAELLQRVRHIAGEFAAHGIELEANRDRLRLAGGKGERAAQGHIESTPKTRFDETATCGLHRELRIRSLVMYDSLPPRQSRHVAAVG